MKTIICQEPGKIEIIEQDNVNTVNAGEVLLSIKRIGICGTDIHAYGGNQPFFHYPRILGHELAAVVVEVGEGVSTVHAGDIVTVIPYMHCGTCISCKNGKTNCCTNMKVLGVHIDGGMTEFFVLPASHVLKVNDLSLDEAALIEPLSIGAHAIRRADVKQADTVLVIGAGPIGLGVAKFAKLSGTKTIVMDISEERLKFCQEWTNCDAIVLSSENNEEILRNLNEGNLPTIVLDATGNAASMMGAFNYASHGGKLIYVGLFKGEITFNDPDFHSKELTLMGSRNATLEDFQHVIQFMENGEIDAEAYISQNLSFEQAVEHFTNKNFNSNKAVITLD
ncbi:zinc-binding alcohol dehydrogenase family protein [Peribacillus sp. NPDC097225]|uniref:zinc-binding alcohol dehydrogenase family protein n=1 Tax=Peribacillus sp. NPDC097225 TaxID=3364400 RepID=UPI0037FF4F59